MRAQTRTLLLCILVAASSAVLTGIVHGSATTIHETIAINSDSGFTGSNGVVTGTGVRTDPYLIEGWKINSTGKVGVNITNTRSYFVISNVEIFGHGSHYGGVGMLLNNVTNGVIQTSSIATNNEGISLYHSSNITLSTNIITNNTISGVDVGFSANLTFTANQFTANGLNFQPSELTDVEWSSFTITSSNTVNGRPIAFYKSCSGLTVDGAVIGQLIVANCKGVKIVNLSITNTDGPVQLGNVSNVLIANSTFSMNHQSGITASFVNNTTIQNVTASFNGNWGLYLWHTNNLTISDSILSSNPATGMSIFYWTNVTVTSNIFARNGDSALGLFFGKNLRVFHNDFIWNNIQDIYYQIPSTGDSWDNGYPSGGNYWTAYGGVDVCSGDFQNDCRCVPPSFETCPDGIGDTPYYVTARYSLNPADRYPLMRPYHPDKTPPAWSAHDGFLPGINSLYLRYTSVWLYWTTATDDVKVTTYRIYSNNILFATLPAEQTNVQGYNVTNLAPGTAYTFEIVAVDEDGNSSPRLSLTLTTPALSSPGSPGIPPLYLAPILVVSALAVIVTFFLAKRHYQRKDIPPRET